MSEDPWRPPQSDLGRGGPAVRRPVALGIAGGVALDIAGTTVASGLFSILFGLSLAASAPTPEELPALLAGSLAYQVGNLVIGTAFTVVGAYYGARISNHLEYWTALGVGVASLVIGEMMLYGVAAESYPTWARLAGEAGIVPAAILGGHIKVRRHGKGSDAMSDLAPDRKPPA